MKLKDAIEKAKQKLRDKKMDVNGTYQHVVIWEQDREWIEINQLQKEGKL